MPAPLLLLPPSKGKAPGGDGPAYRTTLTGGHPLDDARREVLDAVVADAADLAPSTLRRVAGVPERDVGAARATLAGLGGAATLPAHRRYTGVVHGNAGLADLEPEASGTRLRVVSPLLGLVAPAEPVPAYRLELGARLPSLGGLATFWRAACADHLAALADGARVWDLLPGEHRRIWDREVRDGLAVVDVRFQRPDGRAANAARTKVAKGRIAAALLSDPRLTPETLPDAVELDAGWRLTTDAAGVVATYRG